MPPPKPVKYTRRAESTGWLSVKLTKTGSLTSLCEYTKVEIQREEAGRTYFKIMDGYISVGEEASLAKANAALFLNAAGPGGAASLSVEYDGEPVEVISPFKGKLKQQWATLTFNGQTARVTLNSVWDGRFTPLAAGTHNILAPDYAHANISTGGYASATPGMVGNNTWFPIGLGASMQNSSRYVHVGHLSDGCVTVYELGKWSAVYNYLISHRAPGSAGKLIGRLTVTKPKPRTR